MPRAHTIITAKNNLYYGDNLQVLRDSILPESVDLIYLDPPFNSDANYNLLFKRPSGQQSAAQIEVFEDTWHWNPSAENAFDEVMKSYNSNMAELLRSLRSFLGENDMMAYLTMMAVRLIELCRVLKATGSLYLHCDPTASHYLKLLLDATFGPLSFRNEIIWRRTGSHNSSRRFGPVHDVILFYTKTNRYTWNPLHRPYMQGHVDKHFKREGDRYFTNYSGNVLSGSGRRTGDSGKPWKGFDPDAKGRHWALPSKLLEGLEEQVEDMTQSQKMDFLYEKGLITITPGDEWPRYQREITQNDGQRLGDIWAYQPYTEGTLFRSPAGIDDDVRWMGTNDGERQGYGTQKPLGLMERIIMSSSKAGDLILDPFCGGGTTLHAAEKLGRNWTGIDVTNLAISLIERRINGAFPKAQFEVHGTPIDVEGAKALFDQDPYQFQWWAVSLVKAIPYGGKKRGSDGGIDGHIYFKPDGRLTEKAIVSVKGGDNINVSMIRDLGHVVDRERAKIGLLVSLLPPTGPMKTEAVKAGFYETRFGKYPKLQIITIEELFNGKEPQIPLIDPSAFIKTVEELKETQVPLFSQ